MRIDEDERADRPLDPAMERVRRKMIRLLAVSIGVMFVGVIAVLVAVVYRIAGTAGGAVAGGGSAAIRIPAGTEILDAALDGGRVLLRIAGPAGTELILIDLATGATLSRYPVTAD